MSKDHEYKFCLILTHGLPEKVDEFDNDAQEGKLYTDRVNQWLFVTKKIYQINEDKEYLVYALFLTFNLLNVFDERQNTPLFIYAVLTITRNTRS